MANLKTNNLSGEGGRNAYRGSVFFDGAENTYLTLASGAIISGTGFGTGDFTVEFWINQGVNAGDYTNIISLYASTNVKRFQVAFLSSTIQVYTHSGSWVDTGYAPTAGVYEHIAFQRDYSGSTLKMYANGEEKWSASNNRDYDEAFETYIGDGPTAAYSAFQGYLSNVRICMGHLVYSSNYFTPPTSELKVHYISENDKTILLCCQDSDDPTQEATGKTITAYGYFGGDKGTGNLITNGLDWDGATDTESSTMPTNWAAGSGATAEYDTGGTSGGGANRMLRLYNDGSNSFINQEIPTVIGQRYFYNVWYRAKNSSLGVRISAGTSSGATTNLSDQYNVGSANTEDTRTGFFTATATTTHFSLRIISGTNGASVYWDDVIVRAFNPKAPKVIPPYGVDAGNTFGGAISMNSSSWMYFPTGRTEERGRGRGLIVANYIAPANTNACEFITIQSMGNSQDFGDAAAAVRGQAVFASSTRAVSGSGYVAPTNVNTIEFFTIATQSNSTDFGDVTGGNGDYTPISNQTRGIFAGGYSYPAAFNAISFVTIATTGNSTDFGDMTTNRANGNRSAVNSSTRGLIGGGYISPTGTNNIEYLTIATLGNSTDFGDLTAGRSNFTGLCSSTRGVFAGGTNPSNNIMDFVTIASTGDATNFGDMVTGNTGASCSTSNSIRGVIIGGDLQPADNFTNVMQHITIATTGDSQDFGDMLTVGAYRNATSDSHGGLS